MSTAAHSDRASCGTINASARGPPVDDATTTTRVARPAEAALLARMVRRTSREHPKARRIRHDRRAQRTQQPLRDANQIEADRARRLEDEIDRAELERLERRFVAGARRPGTQHHDRSRRLAHDIAERAQPIELRHVHVERNDVGIERVDLFERVVAIARRAGHGKLARAFNDLRSHFVA